MFLLNYSIYNVKNDRLRKTKQKKLNRCQDLLCEFDHIDRELENWMFIDLFHSRYIIVDVNTIKIEIWASNH